MADEGTGGAPKSKATLGLTGLTVNAMALIAPGAFLWLTYAMQAQYGAPMAGSDMWFGILAALMLCLATAISYAELSKLYPGAGSSYFFAEQAFASRTKYAKYARVSKFITGWASHLYYWVYPGVMVGVTALIVGWMLGMFWPATFSTSVASPLFMILFCVVFAFGVAYIAFRGVVGATGVNLAINVIQITALLIFSFMAISYRMQHPEGATAYTMDPDGSPTDLSLDTFKVDKDGNAVDKDGKATTDPKAFVHDDNGKNEKDAAGNWIAALDKDGKPVKFTLSYAADAAITHDPDDPAKPDGPKHETRQCHTTASSVVSPHGLNYTFIQACVAILILVGFESVTSMGEEAKNAKRDIPRAVLLSLAIQGGFCYLIEYFAANYFINSGYTLTTAAGATAPIGDMMQLVGSWFFGSTSAGWWFTMIQAVTVFLALIGTTLSCLSTGARVTYAMGRDDEVPSHFGMLHGKNLTPHRSIWTLAVVSAILGIVCVAGNYCGGAAASDDTIKGLPHNVWYSFGLFSNATATSIPNTLLMMTLVSNFGTFLLYMLTCVTAIVAFQEHHSFNGFKHMFVPIFGLLANLGCMIFYLVGPFSVAGMRWQEPWIALGFAALWGGYGAFYFVKNSKAKGKAVLLATPV